MAFLSTEFCGVIDPPPPHASADTPTALEAIILRAAREDWCSYTDCRVCHAARIFVACVDLIRADGDRSPLVLPRKERQTLIGEKMAQRMTWTLDAQRRLTDHAATLSFARISAWSPLPTAISRLAPVLYYVRDHEAEACRLSKAWLPQLLPLISTNQQRIAGLDRAAQTNAPMTQELLGRIIRGLKQSRRSSGEAGC
ncbi:hypothetical protein [Thauera sp.]|uniref:hypothetical protein n=1 Tax=Thauera sp. TaxID=1905334 RepID=UPI00257F4AB2|nr:hypothetical protein [Thauera sp.]